MSSHRIFCQVFLLLIMTALKVLLSDPNFEEHSWWWSPLKPIPPLASRSTRCSRPVTGLGRNSKESLFGRNKNPPKRDLDSRAPPGLHQCLRRTLPSKTLPSLPRLFPASSTQIRPASDPATLPDSSSFPPQPPTSPAINLFHIHPMLIPASRRT